MPERLRQDFPLFPLGLVALPTEYVPLHIFEPRYRTMVDECLERLNAFGIIWSQDDEMRRFGCAVEIERVLERADDGRINILCRGTQPFALIESQDDFTYPAGTVEFVADEDEAPSEQAADRARQAYVDLVAQATDKTLEDDRVAEMTAYEMAATVEFGLEAKQGLLELRSENARMTFVDRLFRAAAKRLDYVGRAQAQAASNGKVRFG